MAGDSPRPLPSHDNDFYAWSAAQAELLREMSRTRPNAPLDWDHLAEEIEDLGREMLRRAESCVVRILEHLLKLARSPADRPRFGWMHSIAAARRTLDRSLTPTIEARLRDRMDALYADARREAGLALREQGEHAAADALPELNPFVFEDVRTQDRYPGGSA